MTCHIGMNVAWVCLWIWPNLTVVALATLFGTLNLLHGIPTVLSLDGVTPAFLLITLVWISTFALFLWCWFRTSLADPGRVEDDLRARGLLAQIRRGDIPQCLRSLPICHICLLPCPNRSYHCEICGYCVLRFDHHCGIVGACIADKNYKSFILSFFYGALYGVANAVMTWFSLRGVSVSFPEILAIMAGGMSAFFGISLLLIAIVFFCEASCSGNSIFSRTARFRKLLQSFGSSWPARLLPIQRKTTFLAWPGIDWDDTYFCL
jgi:hypothetical protein